MADDTPDRPDLPADLSRLADRLADGVPPAPGSGRPRQRTSGRAFGGALKVSSEMIAGIAVGAGFGWLFDTWLDTSPTWLIICTGLGFAGGLRNVFRTAQNYGRRPADPSNRSSSS